MKQLVADIRSTIAYILLGFVIDCFPEPEQLGFCKAINSWLQEQKAKDSSKS